MRRLLAREDGVALPVALGALAVVTLIAAMTAGGAVNSSDSSTEDRSSKRALAAAEAGLNVASYRVNRLVESTPALLDSQCVAAAAAAPLANGECAPSTGDLGNGTKYSYYVTPKVSSGNPNACPTQIPGDALPAGAGERCVTSVGEADGVVRRVQGRLTNVAQSIFDFQGLVGTSGIKVNNGVVLNSQVGSNGSVTVNGNAKVGDVHLSPTGTIQKSPNATHGTVYTHDAFTLPSLDAEFAESTTSPPNSNSLLRGPVQATANPNSAGYSGTVTWNSVTRNLDLGPRATVTLGPGTYNLCRLRMAKDAKLYTTGGLVKLFIDSPDRDTTCSGVLTPRLDLGSGTQINNPGEAKNLQIYIYGRNDYSEPIVFNNGIAMRAAVYAPRSTLKFASALDIQGAVSAYFLEFSASVNFQWDSSLADIVKAGADYERSAWSECTRTPTTPSDPESGC